MRNEIYEIVQKNNSISFDDVWKKLTETYPEMTKGALAQNIRSLVAERKIIDVGRSLYDPAQLTPAKGFVHWNANQVCWIEDTDTTNDYGIAFNGADNLLMVANKKEALYGSEVEGYLIKDANTLRTSFYINERINMKHVNLFAVLDTTDGPLWQVINSNGGLTINAEYFPATGYKQGDIILIDSLNFKKNSLYGNISDKGIESRIIQTVAGIEQAPSFEDTEDLDKISLNAPFLDKPFYTIDSIYTKDIDDAIWCEKNIDGTFKLMVAIADVSSYVKPGSELDKHAQEACTSFYFHNNTVHMLSKELAEKFCSLNVAQKRGAMVCSLDISSTGEIMAYEFNHQQIRSAARLTYDDVNRLLAGESAVESLSCYRTIPKGNEAVEYSSDRYIGDPLVEESLQNLHQLAQLLHKEYKPDYWFVPSAEMEMDENGKVKSLYMEQRDSSKSQLMVETAMLCANKSAAQFLHNNNIDASALFRNQVAPTEAFERPKPAQYSESNTGHWGLQAQYYTHFTSPIRRYCDLVVHRMIKDVLANKPTYTTSELSVIADKINAQQYKSKVCDNRESNLLMNQYLSKMVETGEINNKYKIVDYSENGVVFRNTQLIELYIPAFKLDRKLVKTIDELVQKDLKPQEKHAALEELNDKFNFKCFVDSYNWITDRKEIGFKIYPRDSEEAKAISEKNDRSRKNSKPN